MSISDIYIVLELSVKLIRYLYRQFDNLLKNFGKSAGENAAYADNIVIIRELKENIISKIAKVKET